MITPNTDRFRNLKKSGAGKAAGKEWIQNEPVILREEGSGTRKEAEKLLKKMGLDFDSLKIVASMENQETIKRSVSRGMGISIISRLAAGDEIKEGKMLEFSLDGESGRRDINVVYNKNFHLSSLAEKFLRVVDKVYPSL